MKNKVLITRPEPDATMLAEEVRLRGFEPVIEPVLSIRFLPFKIPSGYHGLIFSSVNGVRAAAAGMTERRGRVLCVGDRTAEAAREAGWVDVTSAGGTLSDLEALLGPLKEDGSQRFVWLSGFDISRNIEIKNISVSRVVVYRAAKADRLSEDCVDLLRQGKIAAVLFFSARTAEAFSEMLVRHDCTQALKATKALCIADSVLKSLERSLWQDVQVALSPDRSGLMTLLGRYANGDKADGNARQ